MIVRAILAHMPHQLTPARPNPVDAGMRACQTLDGGWFFRLDDADEGGWQEVALPHCWNAADVADDERPYHRGLGWYRRALRIPEEALGKRIHLLFEGANQDAEISVNGRVAGRHSGGYTAFACDISALVTGGDNDLLVRLSNAPDPAVAPVGGDIMAFGGIYRLAHLVLTDPLHFDLSMASSGIAIDCDLDAAGDATVRVLAVVRNARQRPVRATVRHRILDQEGRDILDWVQAIDVPAMGAAACSSLAPTLRRPDLWSPESPALYRLRSELADGADRVCDAVDERFGVRSVEWDAQRGILINGRPRFLRGVGKHQDLKGRGYAVPDAVLREDIAMIRAMGADFTKSHYPLSQGSYAACDSQGVMAWVRIPVMDKVHTTPEFEACALGMLREMVAQYRNHPSVIMWGTACEPLGDADWYWPQPRDPARLAEHIAGTAALLRRLKAELTRLDPSRPTADEYHTSPNPQWYVDSGLSRIHDLNGWNIYQGWYHASLDALPAFLREVSAMEAGRAYLIAEHGAGSDTRIHSDAPTIFDFSTEYQELFHRRYLSAVREAAGVIGMVVWTFVDFEVQAQRNAMPHINNKGLLTGDRRPKDAYHLLRAHWGGQPMVHIASSHWLERAAVADQGEAIIRPIRVYTNQGRVELLLDGCSLGIREAIDRVATWDVPFVGGDNRLLAVGRDAGVGIIRHALTIRYRCVPRDLRRSFPPRLCINVGQTRTSFNDPGTGDIWMPDQPYAAGAFGHLDGTAFNRWPGTPAWDGIREGVDATILGTDIDPVFQTFRLGLTGYRIDAPDGRYRVALYLTEPFERPQRLDPSGLAGVDASGRRCFSILVNSALVSAHLDLAADHGARRAVILSCEAHCRHGSGIAIELRPIAGAPVLCGLAIEPRP
jgi:beta-galactosidase